MKKEAYCTGIFLLSSPAVFSAEKAIYDIKPGDSLSKIVDSIHHSGLGITKEHLFNEILKYNQFIKNPNLIYPGESLVLPKFKEYTYEIKQGDTLSKIIKNHRFLAREISFEEQIQKTLLINPKIEDPNLILTGEKISLGVILDATPVKDYALYRVRKGDNLSKILKNLYTGVDTSLSLHYLKALNPQIEDYNLVYPNQVIKLPSRLHVQALVRKYIERSIASSSPEPAPKFFYPRELIFEVRKLSSKLANKYINELQGLKNNDSLLSWIDILEKNQAIAIVEGNETIEFALSRYINSLLKKKNLFAIKKEMKNFLTIWKKARLMNKV